MAVYVITEGQRNPNVHQPESGPSTQWWIIQPSNEEITRMNLEDISLSKICMSSRTRHCMILFNGMSRAGTFKETGSLLVVLGAGEVIEE